MTDHSAEPFDDAFLAQVRRLRVRLAGSGRAGGDRAGRGSRAGGFLEFESHRGYVPGDDPRIVDWKASGRSGQWRVKEFRREDERSLVIVIDTSASMTLGDPAKSWASLRIAAALGLVALASGFGVRRATAFEGRADPSGRLRGVGASADWLRSLGGVAFGGRAELGRALEVSIRGLAPCTVVIVSDFLEREDPVASLGALRAAGHRPIALQVASPQEARPDLAEALWIVDVEDRRERMLRFGEREREAYLRAITGRSERLERFAARHGCGYRRLVTDRPVVPFLLDAFGRAEGLR